MAATSRDLLIPYGLDETGRPVAPARAQRSGRFRCPECRSALVLRRGEILRPHFAHAQDPSACAFCGEGARHAAAKHAIRLAVYLWRRRLGPCPEILRTCAVCGQTRRQRIPARIARACLEYRAGEAGDARADIALVDRTGETLAYVEIRDTHAVDAAKRGKLGTTPWIELEAQAVLDDPAHWQPLAHDNLRPWRCACAQGRPLAVTARGRALHVDACPLGPRVRRGKTYADLRRDCAQCPDCIGVERRGDVPLRAICRRAAMARG